MNATQRGELLSKGNAARARLLNAAFQLLYSRLAFLHELAGSVVFGPAWSARRQLLVVGDVGAAFIVDVGCGEGRLLANPGWGATTRLGIDPSRQATRRARCRGVYVARGSAQQLPVRSASVGHLVCSYPGPWIMDPAVWAELARVLAPGGSLTILVGGVTTRGRGARVRRLAQCVIYGKQRVDDASQNAQTPAGFGHPAIPGTLMTVEDAWGYAYVWRGSRAGHEPA
jgi:SAM-dependent methyltransferase